MKNFRRILALIVTLTMLFSMTAPAISEGVVDPTPVETPVEEKKDETPVEEKKDETTAEETKVETPAAPTEEKGETPAAPAEEKGETPAAPAEEKGETPAAPAEETKDETPTAPTEETKDEAPAEEKKDETPAAPAEETAPASTGETAEQAPAQEPVPAAGNKEETQEAPAPAQTEEAQPVVQETAPAAAAAAAQTEEEPAPVQEETTEGVEPAMEGEGIQQVEVIVDLDRRAYTGYTFDGNEKTPNEFYSLISAIKNYQDGMTLNLELKEKFTVSPKPFVKAGTYTYDDTAIIVTSSDSAYEVKKVTVQNPATMIIDPLTVTLTLNSDPTVEYSGEAPSVSWTDYCTVDTFTISGESASTIQQDINALKLTATDSEGKYGVNETTGYPVAIDGPTTFDDGNVEVTLDQNNHVFKITPLDVTVSPSDDAKTASHIAGKKTAAEAQAAVAGMVKVTSPTDLSDTLTSEVKGAVKLSVAFTDDISTPYQYPYELYATSGTPAGAITTSTPVGNFNVAFQTSDDYKYTVEGEATVTITDAANITVTYGDDENTAYKNAFSVTGTTLLNTELARIIPEGKDAGDVGEYEYELVYNKDGDNETHIKQGETGIIGLYRVTLLASEHKYTITPFEVTVTARNAEKTYDGNALTCTTFEAKPTDTNVTTIPGTGITAVVMTDGSTITDVVMNGDEVGSVDNVIKSVNGTEVTTGEAQVIGNYKVTTANGTLKINPFKVTVTANNAEKTYDGNALRCTTFEAKPTDTNVTTIPGTGITAVEMTAESTITDVVLLDGTTVSGVANVIKSVNGTEVITGEAKIIGNYEVTTVNGKLTINPLKVTLKLKSSEKFYGEDDPDFASLVTATYISDTIKDEKLFADLKINGENIKRIATSEEAGDYEADAFSCDYDKENTNYKVADDAIGFEEGFKFTIKKLPVTLYMNGKTSKVYGQDDPESFKEYVQVKGLPDGYQLGTVALENNYKDVREMVLAELVTGVTREVNENVGTYYFNENAKENAKQFTISCEAGNNYEEPKIDMASEDADFAFTIVPAQISLYMTGNVSKIYGVKDKDAKVHDNLLECLNADIVLDEEGTIDKDNQLTLEDISTELGLDVVRTGASDDMMSAGEQVGDYDKIALTVAAPKEEGEKSEEDDEAADADIIIVCNENANYVVTLNKEKTDTVFTINKLAVTLTLEGAREKDYGVTDKDAGIDFNKYRFVKYDTKDNQKTQAQILDELKVKVTRPDAGKLSDEKVGKYEYSKAKFPIEFTENNNYKVTVAEKADKFAFTIKPNITIGEMKWTEGNVTTRTGNTIKASFTVPSGKPDVTLDVPMTVTAKLDLSGTNTYLTDEAKAALSALELTGTFTGKTGEIVIPEPDAMKKYVKNGDSWQGGLPVGTKLIVTGVKLGDAEGTVNEAAPAVPVSGFEVAKHVVALTMGVETVGGDAQTAYKVGENSYVVGPEATITLSHDSPLDEYVILTSAAGSKTVLVPANDTVSIKASEMNAGEYEVLGVVTCEDGLYKADSVVMTEITAAMVDDVHLDANTETGEFVLDNVANKNVKAQFENRGKQVTVTLPEATRPGSPVTVTINGMTIPAQTADGTTVTFDVFGIWSANPQNLIRSGEAINVTYTDAVGNVLTAPVSGGSVTKSAGNKITINMRTIDDDDVGSVGGDGKVRIYGEASNYEKVIISVNGTTVAIVDVTGSGNYDPSKSGQWSYVLNLADLDLSTGRVTITAVYDDLTGGDERTFNYKGEVMPVLLTSPLLEQFDKIYGFAEYGTTVHVTINGEDYNTDDNPEMFLTDDAGNTVSVYEHFPSEHDSYFYWIFQCPSRMKPDDDIQIWYEDFTGENVTPEDKRGVQVQAVSDTDAKFDNTAEVLGANVIDYLYMDKDEDGKDIPGTGEMGHNFVTPVDLNKIKEEPLTLPVLAFDGYKVGQVTFSMDDAGQLVVTPEIADDSEGAVKWGVSLFGEKPSIQALRANACGDDLAEKTFNVNGFGDKVWVSARFDVDLSYMRIGGMQDFCALAPHDSSSNNRLQSYAANLGDDNYKFYSESLSEPVIEPEVTED